jgi:hypothetical protein
MPFPPLSTSMEQESTAEFASVESAFECEILSRWSPCPSTLFLVLLSGVSSGRPPPTPGESGAVENSSSLLEKAFEEVFILIDEDVHNSVFSA